MPWDVWLIFFVLGVVVPWRGRVRLRELLAKPQVEARERIALYASTIVFQWIGRRGCRMAGLGKRFHGLATWSRHSS